MPTESEFRSAATGVGIQLTTVNTITTRHRSIAAEPGVEGGTAGPAIAEAIAINLSDLSNLGQQMAALRDELHRRADLCAQFTDDWNAWRERHQHWEWALDRYHRSLDSSPEPGDALPYPGREPTPPPPPFPEAEVG